MNYLEFKEILQKRLNIKDFDRWNKIVYNDLALISRVLLIHSECVEKTNIPNFIKRMFDALWMSFVVFFCVFALSASLGPMAAMIIGCAMAALASLAAHNLSLLAVKAMERLINGKQN